MKVINWILQGLAALFSSRYNLCMLMVYFNLFAVFFSQGMHQLVFLLVGMFFLGTAFIVGSLEAILKVAALGQVLGSLGMIKASIQPLPGQEYTDG